MSVVIRKVKDKDTLRQFVRFPIKLYEGNPYYVPALIYDEATTLRRDKNPAFEHSDAAYFLAYKNDEIVGRIAAIINYAANNRWQDRSARFGFVDFIDDNEVVDALFNAAEDWAKFRGMNAIRGPLGFTDLDAEGMLTDGYEEIGTMSTIYNHPYYLEQLRRIGYQQEAQWYEFLIKIPTKIPERHERLAEITKKRFGLDVIHFEKKSELMPYAREIFQLINRTYNDLYGFSQLSDKQIDYYVNMYIPMFRLDFLSLVIRREDNKIIGVGIGLPSLSKALQKSKGKFMPLGWYHIYNALKGKNNNVLDLLLVAVDKEYQGKGINALMFCDFIPACAKYGIEYAETNPELATNTKVHALWKDLEATHHKTRATFIKELNTDKTE